MEKFLSACLARGRRIQIVSEHPQLLPTERARGLFEGSLRFLEKIPGVKCLLRPRQSVKRSEVPISLVIPLHPKDIWVAPTCLEFARKNLSHPITEVVIVSKDAPEIQAWVKKEGLRWVDEGKVLSGIEKPSQISLPEQAAGLESWVFQQLIKLAADNFVESECFLILDSDTLLLAPRVFKSKDELWLDYSHERNLLYLKGYEALLGSRAGSLVSFVCHHMFGEKKILGELKSAIESKTGQDWSQAILNLVSSEVWTEKEKLIRPFNFFSEYETYGNYCKNHYRRVKVRYFRNHGAKEFRPSQMTPKEYVATLPTYFKWASFHSYYGYEGLEKLKQKCVDELSNS